VFDRLLEPVMGERFVVEGLHFPVPGRAVEADGLHQGLIGLQPYRPDVAGRGVTLELAQQPSAEPQTTGCAGDPHPLDLRRLLPTELQGPAPDGLVPEPSNQQEAGWFGQLLHLCGIADGGVEPGGEAPIEVGEVLADAELRDGEVEDEDEDEDEDYRSCWTGAVLSLGVRQELL
jgi:hypothetical protein